MAKTKISWTDFSWNSIWGCNFSCTYCFARNIAKRFASQIAKNELNARNIHDIQQRENIGEDIENNIKKFIPTFLESTHNNFKFPKKASRIFIGSMSDIAFWKDEWFERVIEKIKQHPQHTFQLLTKSPKIYEKLDEIMPDNVWFGVTVTNQKELQKTDVFRKMHPDRVTYVSFEPLLSNIKNEDIGVLDISYFTFIDWIIIGTMSGRKRTPAKNEWIKNIINEAKEFDIPVFVKQIELNGKVEKDISNFPKELQFQNFPK